MNLKQEIHEEALGYRKRREPNAQNEQTNYTPCPFKGGIHSDMTIRKVDERQSANASIRRAERRDFESGNHINDRDDLNDKSGMDRLEKDDSDGGEYEMILGDIPEVTIPSSCYNTVQRGGSSSSLAERMRPKKKRPSRDKDGDTGDTISPPSQDSEGFAAPSRYACRKCSLIFSKFEFLNAHMSRIHPVVGPYRCPNCVFETKFHSMLQLHMKEPHVGDTKKANSKEKKVVGKRIDEPRMQCPLCTYEASSLANFTSHSRISHRNAFEKMAHRNADSNRHRCPFRPACSYQAKNREMLESHYKSEHKQRLWHCPECDFYTVWKVALNRHLKAHRENPEHKCDECGQRFALRTYLNHHYNESECKEKRTQQDQMDDHSLEKVNSPTTCVTTLNMEKAKDLSTADRNDEILSSMLCPASPPGKGSPLENDRSPKTGSSSVRAESRRTEIVDLHTVLPGCSPAILEPLIIKDSPSKCRNTPSSSIMPAPSVTSILNGRCPMPSPQELKHKKATSSVYSSGCESLSQTLHQNTSKSKSLYKKLQSPEGVRTCEPDRSGLTNSPNDLNQMTPTSVLDTKLPSSITLKLALKPFEVIDLTDDNPPVSTYRLNDNDNLDVSIIPLNVSQKKSTVKVSNEKNLPQRTVPLEDNAKQCSMSQSSVASSRQSPKSVTIVWDTEFPGIAKGFRSNETIANNTTSSIQINLCDGGLKDKLSVTEELLPSTVSQKVTNKFVVERSRSNLSAIYNEGVKESSNSTQSCDIDFSTSSSVTGYRESSPSHLVIDDTVTAD